MRKFAIGVVTVLATVILCLSLSGCAANVSGKTYVFDSYKIQYSDMDNEDKEKIDALATLTKDVWKLNKFTFKDDGTVLGTVNGAYTQDGNKVTVTLAGKTVREFKVSGSAITEETTIGDNVKVTLKYVPEEK